MGGFAIGTTEFVTMGLLPQIAAGVDVSIPTGGHVISAYALGVVVGAPVIAFFGARLPRRGLLVALMVAFAVGNAASALATSFEQLMLARLATGFPHGAYFGVASLVAASMAPPGRKGRAVAQVMLGLSVANVLGVPAATWLGQELGWRSAFWAVTALALLTWHWCWLSCRRAPEIARPPGGASCRLHGPPGLADPARRCDRLRRHVRGLHLHRPRRHRRRRPGGAGGADLPAGLRPRHGRRHLRSPAIMADWSIFRSLLIGGVGMAPTLLAFWVAAPQAGGLCRSSSSSPCSARCWWSTSSCG